MRKQCTLLLLLLLPLLAMAQNITVPNNVYFADIHLKLSDGAQQEIQKKVDALHRNQTYFKKKVELADAYFPIIERVFKEEGVPDDFKYLALQESGLVGDAVSTSNAVGYWQFKKEAASDFNLRMDNVVDERRHIIEASRGAARYFKRSNNYYDNWFNALLSYYLGYTGVKNYTTARDVGAKKMEITERSHPYILTFLAHKIAYDNFVGKNTPVVSLREMRATPGQSLSEIALATKTDYAELERYNKWLLGNSIPSGKDYYVLVPVRNGDSGLLASNTESDKAFGRQPHTSASAAMVKRNGLNALIARPGDTKDKLALQAGISTRRFLKYNDLHSFDNIEQGAAYYIEPKKTTAEAEFHVVQPGENMQQISQHYGLKLNYLRYKNRMSRNEVPVPGRVLWLQKRRPMATAVEVRDVNKPTMASAAAPASYSKPAASSTTPQTQTPAPTPEQKPKENIFTRFFNSLKGNKKQPETRTTATEKPVPTPQAAAPAPVKVAAPAAAKQANTATQENEVEEADTVAVQEEATPVAEPAPAVLYPAASKATADTTLLQEEDDWAADTVNWPVNTTPAATETAGKPKAESTATKAIFKEPAPKAATPAKPSTTAAAVTPAKAPATTAKRDTTAKAQPQQAPAKPTRHVVKQGETLYGISRMYAVTVNDITRWNNLNDVPLKMGQELLIAEPLTTPAQTEAPEASAAPAKATNGIHTVAAHETLYQISKMYNVTLEELREWNSLSDNAIKPGQQLQVVAPAAPAKTSEATPAAKSTFSGNSTYHTVAPGESMYQISRQYGVTIKDIMEWNNKNDFAVSAGEKLLIRKK